VKPSSLPRGSTRLPAEKTRDSGKAYGMVTLVEEPVDVSAVFRGGRLRPMAFMWRGRSYRVRRVMGTYRTPKGRCLELYYSVMSDTPEVYELRFSTEGMSWSLVRVHGEG
jgi:hypothetical protein